MNKSEERKPFNASKKKDNVLGETLDNGISVNIHFLLPDVPRRHRRQDKFAETMSVFFTVQDETSVRSLV